MNAEASSHIASAFGLCVKQTTHSVTRYVEILLESVRIQRNFNGRLAITQMSSFKRRDMRVQWGTAVIKPTSFRPLASQLLKPFPYFHGLQSHLIWVLARVQDRCAQ